MSQQQKFFVWGPKDSTHPYRVCAPSFTLGIQRFDNLPQAEQYLNEMKDRGHQAIMSIVDIDNFTYSITKYVQGSNYKRKE